MNQHITTSNLDKQEPIYKYIYYLEYHFQLLCLDDTKDERKKNIKNIIKLFEEYKFTIPQEYIIYHKLTHDDMVPRESDKTLKNKIIAFLMGRIQEKCEDNPSHINYVLKILEGSNIATLKSYVKVGYNSISVSDNLNEAIKTIIRSSLPDDLLQSFGKNITVNCNLKTGTKIITTETDSCYKGFVSITILYIEKMKKHIESEKSKGKIFYDSFYIYILRLLLFVYKKIPVKGEDIVIDSLYVNYKKDKSFYCQMFVKLWHTFIT
jgi:hypothetical protein